MAYAITDVELRSMLEKRYEKKNCIKLKDYLYIVRSDNLYYLMQNKAGEAVFDTNEATLLKEIVEIEANEPTEINPYITIKSKNGESTRTVMQSIAKAIKELLQRAN